MSRTSFRRMVARRPLPRQLRLSQVKAQLARIPVSADVIVSARATLDAHGSTRRTCPRVHDGQRCRPRIRDNIFRVAAGTIGQPPVRGKRFQLTIQHAGARWMRAFGNIIVKQGSHGEITHVHDVARSNRGARLLGHPQLSGKPAAALVISNYWNRRIETSDAVRAKMEELKRNSPLPALTMRDLRTTLLRAIHPGGCGYAVEAVCWCAGGHRSCKTGAIIIRCSPCRCRSSARSP